MKTLCYHLRAVRPIALMLFCFFAVSAVALSQSKTWQFHAQLALELEQWLGSDLYLHFLLAFALNLSLLAALSGALPRMLSVALSSGLLLLICAAEEFSQRFFTTRHFSWWDLLASSLGVFASALIGLAALYLLSAKPSTHCLTRSTKRD